MAQLYWEITSHSCNRLAVESFDFEKKKSRIDEDFYLLSRYTKSIFLAYWSAVSLDIVEAWWKCLGINNPEDILYVISLWSWWNFCVCVYNCNKILCVQLQQKCGYVNKPENNLKVMGNLWHKFFEYLWKM